jgi:WD40 repeat protein
MNCRSGFLIAALLLSSAISPSQTPALKFVKKIGVGWGIDKWGWMGFVAFSPDGTKIASDAATAADDVSGNLTIWSFPEGHLLKRVPGKPEGISTDWKYYATAHGVGEMETGKPLISEADNVYPTLAFSPDSRYVAESIPSKHAHMGAIRIVELDSHKEVNAFGRRGAFSIAISPDGMTLASGYWDVVTLWNMLTGERLAVFHGFEGYVESLAFSKDGKLLATGTDAGGFQIWDVQHQSRLHSLNPVGTYYGHVSEPAFSPDGQLVAVGVYGSGTVYLIDAKAGKVLDQKKVSDLGCGSVAFSADGHYLITPSTGGLITWPYDIGGTIRVFEVRAP